MKIAALYRYPVKSLGGQSVSELRPEGRGFEYDRRWMFTEPSGLFISRRATPKMAEFAAEVHGENLHFVRVTDGALVGAVAGATKGSRSVEVTVWDDRFAATLIDRPEVAAIAEAVGLPGAQLVYMGDDDVRPVDQRYARPGQTVSFADGFPYLITNTASLDDLSGRVGEGPLDVRRFRPNIVVGHDVAYAEDDWAGLEIGTHRFRLPKPCARCIMITQHPDTGERTPRIMGELAHYRRRGNKVVFGMNACWEGGAGGIRVGDSVEVKRYGPVE